MVLVLTSYSVGAIVSRGWTKKFGNHDFTRRLELEPIEIEFPSVGYIDVWLTDSETIRTCSDLYKINNVECEMWKGSTTYVNCILYFRFIFTWETLSPPP